MAAIRCAFCGGKGSDPFNLLSPLARCQACAGKGAVTFEGTGDPCPNCHGSGRAALSNLPCTHCRGRGAVTLPV